MKLKLKPHDENVSYEVEINSKMELVNMLIEAELVVDTYHAPVKLINKWYDMLVDGIAILSPKHLKTSIQFIHPKKEKVAELDEHLPVLV